MADGIDYEEGREFAKEPSRLHRTWRRSNPTQYALHTILEARGRGLVSAALNLPVYVL